MAHAAQDTQESDSDAQRRNYAELLQKKFLLERELQLKRIQLDLAAEDAPYLMVDLAARELRIYVRTTAVKSVPLASAEIEGERRVFSAVDPPPDWANRAFSLLAKSGDIDSPEQVAPGSGAENDEINPRAVTPELLGLDEEVFPQRYTLLFREGIAVSIGGSGLSEEEKGWLLRGWETLTGALVTPELPEIEGLEPVQVWIHLRLTAEEAQSLYPSIYSDMRAMVRLPGDPRL